MPTTIPRRRFLARAAGSAAGLLILPSARMVRGYPANERLNLAVVGMAGYGAYHGFAEAIHTYDQVRYAYSCDVDLRKVRRVYELWEQRARQWSNSDDQAQRRAAEEYYGPLAENKPPLFQDYRRMLDEAGDQIDAVVVATPDHTHAIIAAAALRAGKPVLAEKPLTISAHEARELSRLAKRTKLPTQMNNGGAASPGFRRGVEILREGLIGPVQQVHVFFSRGGRNFQQPPPGGQPVPPELDWNLWLAQVAWREYDPGWINRIAWRETSIGELGNFGPHSANMAFMALNVKDLWDGSAASRTIRIQAECSEANQLSYPRWEKIRWDVPERDGLPPVTFTWHHGYPPEYAPGSREMLAGLLQQHGASEQEASELLPYAGCIIVGAKGLLATNSHNTTVRLLPVEKFASVEQNRPLRTPTSPGHYREWVQACRDGSTPISNFEYAAPFAEFLNVGSLATRFPGETIEFDPVTGRITNHAEAASHLQYPYRDGWTI
ncbi:MAG: Gfo/Idh/MocA family oxidoreductase [Pirellulaceae bacterium]|nr:Gfo/Idh/MocA family oxidoreductase [Pirellulaceae bacterium]